MATPIPGLVSEIVIDGNTDGIQVTTGTAQTLSQSYRYFLVSNMAAATATNGVSLLAAIKAKLEASLAGTTWTVKLSSGYKVQLSHDNGSSRTVTFDANLATYLGFTSASFAVAASTTVTATNFSVWWWTPDMSVSETGPQGFDPAISYGVPSSAGTAQRSSDMTGAFTDNGIQTEAVYIFRGVEYYYKIRPQSGFTNYDLETWWSYGPRKGRKFLWWRDRDNATGSHVPTEGAATPYNYIIYQPQPALRTGFPAIATSPNRLTHWDVTFAVWATEVGETPLAD